MKTSGFVKSPLGFASLRGKREAVVSETSC